jgi:hypothetical protein
MKGAILTGLSFLAMVLFSSTGAAAVVTNCEQGDFRAAIAQGGTVTFACAGVIGISPELVIATNVVLDGTGQNVVFSGMSSNRLFQILPGRTLTLIHLTLINGLIVGADGASGGAGEPALGGAVFNDRGTLKAIDCVFVNNAVVGGTGGPAPISGGIPGSGGAAGGGAIYSYFGTNCLTNVFLHGNTATGGRGAAAAPGGMSVVGGPGGSAAGGAILTFRGPLITHAVHFQTNRVIAGPGGRSLTGVNDASSGLIQGGAACSIDTEVRFFASDFTANSCIPGQFYSPASGGAVYHSSPQTGYFEVIATTFRSNRVSSGAQHSFASQAAPGNGGALWLAANQATVSDCSFFENVAIGGAVLTGNGLSGAGEGGAIWHSHTLCVARSTFSGNLARGGDVLGIGSSDSRFPQTGRGGAIFSTDTTGNPIGTARLFVDSSTFAGNVATGGSATNASNDAYGVGGAICGFDSSLTLNHVTAVSNAAYLTYSRFGTNHQRGGALFGGSGSATLRHSVFAHSLSGSNVVLQWSTLTDAGGNISSDATPGFTGSSRNHVDPLLGPLGDYGGLTLTMPPLPGSPAINAVPPGSCRGGDQRGVARGYDAGCDIGAFEHWTGDTLALSANRAGASVLVAFAGQPGQTYRVLTSSNLATWTWRTSVTVPPTGVYGFFESADSPKRFFTLEKPAPQRR